MQVPPICARCLHSQAAIRGDKQHFSPFTIAIYSLSWVQQTFWAVIRLTTKRQAATNALVVFVYVFLFSFFMIF